MAHKPEGFDSDTVVDPCTLQEQNHQEKKSSFNHIPPVLENGEKSRNRRSHNRRRNNKKKQSQAESTLADHKVPVQEYPTSDEDKLDFSRHPRQQQMFDPKVFIISGLSDTTTHSALFGYLKRVTRGDLKRLTLLGEGRAVVEVAEDISGFGKLKSNIWRHKTEVMHLTIERVHACDSILVRGLSPSVTRDAILLYFKNVQQSGGGDVSNVSLCKRRNGNTYAAVVTFVNPEVIAKVVQRQHFLESQKKLTVEKYFPQIAASSQGNVVEEERSAQNHMKPVKRLRTFVKVDNDIMQFIKNGVHFQELEGKLDELNAEIVWISGSNSVKIWKKADSSYVKNWVIRCKTVFVEFFNRFNKSSLSLEESIQNAVSVALPRLEEMVSPEKALWKQIKEKQELMVVSLKEETDTVLQSVREFVEIIKEEIRKTYKKEPVRRIDEPVKRLCTSVEVDDNIMQFIMNGDHFQELESKLDKLNAEIEWRSGSNSVTLREKADSSYAVKNWVITCETVFVEFLDRFNKSSLSLEESIQNAVSVPLPRLAEMVSPEKALCKQIEDKQELMVVCLKEETATCTVLQSVGEFEERVKEEIHKKEPVKRFDELDHMKKSIDLHDATNIVEKSEKELQEFTKSQRVEERVQRVSNGVARFLKENLSREINNIEAQLKNDQVVIEVNSKKLYSTILCRGTESGLDKCKKSISELCQMVIEKKKDLSSPGLSKLLFSETGQLYLRVIETKNRVVIEMTRESRKGVKETSQTEVNSLRDELKKDKKKRLSSADDHSRHTTETEAVQSAYDLCNFTTNEGISVSWKYGNIADETADILVNSAQSNLRYPTACGQALNIVGGPSFIQACRDQESISTGGVVLTGGGKLSCSFVLHAVCCSWDNYRGNAEELLRNLVREILRKCEQCHATSLAMPAIGTGKHMFPEGVVFRIFRQEFEIFSSFQTTFTLRDIRIVVFAKQLTTQVTQPTQVHGKQTTKSVFDWISSVFNRLTSSPPTTAEAPQSTPFTPLTTGEPKQTVNLHVFALSNESIDASFDEVDTFVKNQTTTKEIEHEKVFDVFLEHWSKVQELARHHDVKITCLKSSVALIEGSVTNVLECKEKLMRLITESVEEERKMNQLKYISKNVQWHYFQGSREVKYNSEVNGLIETASMENKQFLEITKFGEQHEIDLIHMMEKNKKTGRTEKITRKSLGETNSDISLPPNWDPQPQGQVVHLVTLSRSSREYQRVLSHFNSKGGSGSRVSNIQRIQNPRLYMAFLAAKKSMSGADSEMQLFHGTSASNTESINANNFSRSFAGENGVAYGDGVYFARDSSYSLRYSQVHGNSGNFKMYVARVLVGQYTVGRQGMKAPPSRNDPANPGVRYDSVVDKVRNPSIFVMFVDNHCYPEYLITFSGAT